MNIFYKVDHRDLKLEVFKDLKHNHRIATLLVWSMVKSVCKDETGYLDFYQSQTAADLGIGVKTIRAAEKRLIESQMIKVISPYQRVGNIPTRYGIGRLGIRCSKVRHSMSSGRVSDAKVNNTKGIINKDNSFFRKESSSKLTDKELVLKYKEEGQGSLNADQLIRLSELVKQSKDKKI